MLRTEFPKSKIAKTQMESTDCAFKASYRPARFILKILVCVGKLLIESSEEGKFQLGVNGSVRETAPFNAFFEILVPEREGQW